MTTRLAPGQRKRGRPPTSRVETLAAVLACHAEGLPLRETAARLGITVPYTRTLALRAGVRFAPLPRGKYRRLAPEVARRLLLGHSQRRIRQDLGIHVGDLIARARHGLVHAPELLAVVGADPDRSRNSRAGRARAKMAAEALINAPAPAAREAPTMPAC